MPKYVIVKRYDKPNELFGVHSNARGAHYRREPDREVYDAIRLFNLDDLLKFIKDNDLVGPVAVPDLDTLIDCAPVEWHEMMKEGKMLERFTAYTTR